MDLFGIGPLEMVLVLLVATIVLGPAKMVDVARNLGKYWREAQRTLRELADAATVRLDVPTPEDETQEESVLTPEGSITSTNGVASPDAPAPQEESQHRG